MLCVVSYVVWGCPQIRFLVDRGARAGLTLEILEDPYRPSLFGEKILHGMKDILKMFRDMSCKVKEMSLKLKDVCGKV